MSVHTAATTTGPPTGDPLVSAAMPQAGGGVRFADDLVLRPISGPDELPLFSRLPYVLNSELADDLAAGRRAPAWMWMALRGDQLVARVAWWCREGESEPYLLDILDFDETLPRAERVALTVRLLRTALAAVVPDGAAPPEYLRFAPPDWRAEEASRTAVEDRMAAVEQTGGRLLVERLRLQWDPGTRVAAGGRLAFRALDGTSELLDLMARVLPGTLDAHSRADLERMAPREAAAHHYAEELAMLPSPRAWWRVATLAGGEAVGFVLPARNHYNAIIAYLAVLPEHRGRGYVDEILAEGTRVLAAAGVPRIRASTDRGNTPMAEAFARAGYVTFERAINMTWS